MALDDVSSMISELNGRMQYNTANFPNGNLPLSGEVNVHDIGATLFGSYSFSDMVHIKY
ncbi:MAG: hypothetical protein R6V60_19600 [Desulfobacterales bacterium]|jgi:hypothetical protein